LIELKLKKTRSCEYCY